MLLTLPTWFSGAAQHWTVAEQRFDQGIRESEQGRQHAWIGWVLMTMGAVSWGWHAWSDPDLMQGWSQGGALMVAGLWANHVRRIYRKRAESNTLRAMGLIVAPLMLRLLKREISKEEQVTMLQKAQAERLASPEGSFRELASAIVEGRLTGKRLRHFYLSDGRMVFKGFQV